MFGVVVFGLHQDLRFVHFDEQLEHHLKTTCFDEEAGSVSSKHRQAEFCFLPLLVLCETYQLRLEDRLLSIKSESLSVELSEQDGVTIMLIRGANAGLNMDTVKAVLRLCFGTLLAALRLERLQEQNGIAERLLQEIAYAESLNTVPKHMENLNNSIRSDDADKQHAATAKILLLFLKMFFADSLDGVVYVQQEHRVNLYGGRRWSSCVLSLLVKLSCLVEDQSAPSHRISAFLQVDDDDSFTAVDVYFYRLSASVCLLGIVRMKHSNLLSLLSRQLTELELARTGAYGCFKGYPTSSQKLVGRQKTFLRRLKVELKRCNGDIHLDRLQTALCDVSRFLQRRSILEDGDLAWSIRRAGSILHGMLDKVYSLCHGRVEQSNLDLFNVCCESLLCAPQVGRERIRECVFEKVLQATGPLASTMDLDAEAYVFGKSNGHLRVQAGSAELLRYLLLIRFDQLSASLYCFRYQQYVCILIKRTSRQGFARLKGRSFRKLMEIALRELAGEKDNDMPERDSTYIIAAYAGFINLSLALGQTWCLAERLNELVEQSWQFHRVAKA